MMFNLLLSWTFLLVATGPLLAHPITDSAEMPYPGPVSVEDGGAGSPDELSFSELTYLPQVGPGLRYSPLLSGDLSRDGLSAAGLLKRQMKRDEWLEKQSHLNPFSRFFGIRKQSRKRGGASECFWKYCV
ncbi:urotensin-2-like [Oncorhynchus nerka]|uniref:urotensin-2-like n=1 Tax=Oncorhynchus nerka TaxID=8023 RepID=UPI001131F089|nr:urotensin-2-like [Oncorhynchus nerka]XP_035595554.1 urotensin-2-like [Oncorhynchus keta]